MGIRDILLASAMSGGSGGKINVKTGKFVIDEINGVVTYGGRNTGNLEAGYGYIDGKFYSAYMFNIAESGLQEGETSAGINVNKVAYNGQFFQQIKQFAVEKRNGMYYFFVLLVNDNYKRLWCYETENSSIVEESQTMNINFFDVQSGVEYIVQNDKGIFLVMNDGSICTNSVDYNVSSARHFQRISLNGIDLTAGNYTVTGQGKYLYFLNEDTSIIEIYDTENDYTFLPQFDGFSEIMLTNMTYWNGMFIGCNSNTGEVWYAKDSGVFGDMSEVNWQQLNVPYSPSQYSLTPDVIFSTDNYLFVPSDNYFLIYDKNFNCQKAQTCTYLLGAFEITDGVLLLTQNGDCKLAEYETKELTIEEAINRLI